MHLLNLLPPLQTHTHTPTQQTQTHTHKANKKMATYASSVRAAHYDPHLHFITRLLVAVVKEESQVTHCM